MCVPADGDDLAGQTETGAKREGRAGGRAKKGTGRTAEDSVRLR